MPRALCVVRSDSAGASRADALARFRATRQRAASASCNYWIFEERGVAWVEFFEARDDATLRDALHELRPAPTSEPILSEVELD